MSILYLLIYRCQTLTQEDNLEIPFIYTYRRDYLHPSLDRKHLWFVLTCDEKWEQLMIAKSNLIKVIGFYSIDRSFSLFFRLLHIVLLTDFTT